MPRRRPTDLEVARAIHYNESLRQKEPEELSHEEVMNLFDEEEENVCFSFSNLPE